MISQRVFCFFFVVVFFQASLFPTPSLFPPSFLLLSSFFFPPPSLLLLSLHSKKTPSPPPPPQQQQQKRKDHPHHHQKTNNNHTTTTTNKMGDISVEIEDLSTGMETSHSLPLHTSPPSSYDTVTPPMPRHSTGGKEKEREGEGGGEGEGEKKQKRLSLRQRKRIPRVRQVRNTNDKKGLESNMKFTLSSVDGLGKILEEHKTHTHTRVPSGGGGGGEVVVGVGGEGEKERGGGGGGGKKKYGQNELAHSVDNSMFDEKQGGEEGEGGGERRTSSLPCDVSKEKASGSPKTPRFFGKEAGSPPLSMVSGEGSSVSDVPTAVDAAFSKLPKFTSETDGIGGGYMSPAIYRQKEVMGLEILSTGEKTYFTKTLRDLCVLLNQIATGKEKARFGTEKKNKKRNNDGNQLRATGWLVPRDLRRLDFSLFPNLEPQILPRRHCIIFAIEQLRGILTEDRLILLLPEGADGFLQMLDKRLAFTLEYPKISSTKNYINNLDDYLDSARSSPFFLSTTSSAASMGGVFPETQATPNRQNTASNVLFLDDVESISDEESQQEGEVVYLPFELRVLDSILETVVWLKQRELKFLFDHKEEFIHRLRRKKSLLTTTKAQDELRSLRTDVLTMKTRLTNVRRVLEGLLDNEEDMALCNLSLLANEPELYDPPLSPTILEAHAEVELLLEAYLQNFHELLSDLDVTLHELDTTEALMSLRLDTARNQLLSYNTIFSLVAMGFGVGSYIGSLFGTNLESGLEQGTQYFIIVCVTTSAAVVLIILIISLIMYQKDLLVK